MSWVKSKIELGQMYENTKKDFSFDYIGNLKILKVTPGCSNCTKVSLKGNKLNVTYKANKIPIHIKMMQDFQLVTKTINVKYEDGNEKTLLFTAKIIKNETNR